jgi:hypothetical protein
MTAALYTSGRTGNRDCSTHLCDMRRILDLLTPNLVARLAVAALLTWLIFAQPFSPHLSPQVPTRLEFEIASPQAGSVSLRIDEGHGVAMNRPANIRGGFDRQQSVSLVIPPGQVRALRLSFYQTPSVTLDHLRILPLAGVIEIAPQLVKAAAETAGRLVGDRLELSAPSGGPMTVEVTFPSPLYFPHSDEPQLPELVLMGGVLFALLWLLELLVARRFSASARERLGAACAGVWRGAQLKPPMTLAAVALFAAIVSCWPVVVGERSFVAPANGAPLLYFGGATIPGAPPETPEDSKGADVAAMMWQNLPYSAIEHDALLKDHEWPLWNRYSSGGVPLLGQGLSMLGDPVHLLPLLTNGAAWAWDFKFLIAKTLFALGLGLSAWMLTRQLGIAMLLTLSSAWIGFFAFRFNHPAFFSVCYAPWILLPWLAIGRAQTWRAQWGWAAALILADLMVLASGTAKEPSMLLLCLNATGLLALALSGGGLRRIAVLCWASVLFLLLSAPCWLVFLDALRHSATISDTPNALQLQPGLLIAFFDDIFSQDFTKLEYHTHPSLNFLVLAAMLWLAAAWRRTLANKATLGLALGAVLPLALVFGVVPPAWITAIPFIGNLQHIYNVFGSVLVILFPLLAAAGLADCCANAVSADWLRTWRTALIVGGVIALGYVGFTQAIPQQEALAFKINAPLHSRFYLAYAPALLLALSLLPWALRWLRTPGARTAGLGLALVCGVVLHFRHGMYNATKFDDYVMNPKTGVDLVAQSPAVGRVKLRLTEPYRTYGVGYTLSPGYNALLGLEGICGPDALMNREYREFCRAAHLPLDLDWRLRIDEAALPQLQPVFDSLNLRFYLRDGDGPPPAGFAHVGRADLAIFESKQAWPRAFFTDQMGTYPTAGDYVQMLLAVTADRRAFAARQSETPGEPPTAERKVVPARGYLLTNNSTEFTIDAPSAGVVVLTESYEEGNFQLTVNGAPAEYFRVNHMHKGLSVPAAGTYRIRFTYQPRLFDLSLWLSAVGALLALVSPFVAALFVKRTARRDRNEHGAERLLVPGRAGVSPALPGVPPGRSNHLGRCSQFDVGPRIDDPGGTPGSAGGTPALPGAI